MFFFKRMIFLLTSLVLLSSCVLVQTEHPLSDPGKSSVDKRLQGIWYAHDKTPGYVHIVPLKDGLLHMVLLTYKERKVEVLQFKSFSTKIGKRYFLNFLSMGKKRYFNRYLLATYTISKRGILTVRLFSQKAFAKAIEEGKLKGVVKRDSMTKRLSRVLITASTAKLVAFVAKAGPAYFNKNPLRLYKVLSHPPFSKLPTTRRVLKRPASRPTRLKTKSNN